MVRPQPLTQRSLLAIRRCPLPQGGEDTCTTAPDRWVAWLGETAATDAGLKAMLKPYPGDSMTFWPVGRRVGNVRNDSPDLFAPLSEPV
jgi:hypothetical protein